MNSSIAQNEVDTTDDKLHEFIMPTNVENTPEKDASFANMSNAFSGEGDQKGGCVLNSPIETGVIEA